MNDMKISFKVEITRCIGCPYSSVGTSHYYCEKASVDNKWKTAQENLNKLTKTCPMVRAQFEALE